MDTTDNTTIFDPVHRMLLWKETILRNPERLHEEDMVIRKFGSMFQPSNLDALSKEDFKSFLVLRNNRHWSGLQRQGKTITSDMEKLRQALKILLDESIDIHDRLSTLFPSKGKGYIRGMGRAFVTPILLVAHPDKYGIWNNKTEDGLKKLGMFPKFTGKDSTADKYVKINEILKGLAAEYGVTLWQLDELMGAVATNARVPEYFGVTDGEIPDEDYEEAKKTPESMEEFALESQLQSFLIENWDKLDIGKTHDILEENGDLIGSQFITPVGIIDILAKSKDGKEWLVIELKKGKSNDKVVGQTLRYVGWIKSEKAAPGEMVRGLIILGENDERIRYAVSSLPDMSVMTYSVNFQLKNIGKI